MQQSLRRGVGPPPTGPRLRRRGRPAAQRASHAQLGDKGQWIKLQCQGWGVFAAAPTACHARHGRLRVDPKRSSRKLEGDDEALAGEDGLAEHPMCGDDHHSRHREVDDSVADEAEVALAHDLTGDTDRVAAGFAPVGENDGTHRCLL